MAETNWTLLQPNWVAWQVNGKWIREQKSAPPGAVRIQKDWSLTPVKQYRIVHQHTVAGKVMALPNGQPILLYTPALDATAFGTPIANPADGTSTVNVQANFPLDDAGREYWFEELT